MPYKSLLEWYIHLSTHVNIAFNNARRYKASLIAIFIIERDILSSGKWREQWTDFEKRRRNNDDLKWSNRRMRQPDSVRSRYTHQPDEIGARTIKNSRNSMILIFQKVFLIMLFTQISSLLDYLHNFLRKQRWLLTMLIEIEQIKHILRQWKVLIFSFKEALTEIPKNNIVIWKQFQLSFAFKDHFHLETMFYKWKVKLRAQ